MKTFPSWRRMVTFLESWETYSPLKVWVPSALFHSRNSAKSGAAASARNARIRAGARIAGNKRLKPGKVNKKSRQRNLSTAGMEIKAGTVTFPPGK